MKYLFWNTLWRLMVPVQALALCCISGAALVARQVSRATDAAEIEMLIARAERVLRAKRAAHGSAGKAPDNTGRPQ